VTSSTPSPLELSPVEGIDEDEEGGIYHNHFLVHNVEVHFFTRLVIQAMDMVLGVLCAFIAYSPEIWGDCKVFISKMNLKSQKMT